MFSKKSFAAGLIAGCVLAGGSAVFASSSVQASLINVHFLFNGVEKQLPDGYVALNYQGRSYVPARFVAEQLGATVGWDNSTSSVTIDSNSYGSGGSSSSGSSSTSGTTVGNYTFSNYSMKNNDDIYTSVMGEIVNNDKTSHNVNLTVNFYDAKGNLLGTASGVVMDLGPGQKKSFECDAQSVLQGVNTYSFQVDGEW